VITDAGSLSAPLGWDVPGWVVLGSLCDLFHSRVSDDTISEVMNVIAATPRLTYRLLTKRSKRLLHLGNEGLVFPPNLWLGVSIESDDYTWRAEDLLRVNAHASWVAVEPLLGPVPSLPLAGLGWVVCAPESGVGARTFEEDWVRALRDACTDAGVPFRYGSLDNQDAELHGHRPGLPLLDGALWDETPHVP
jgi:protein gp37